LSSTETPEATPVVDTDRDSFVAEIRARLGSAVLDSFVKPGDDIWIRLAADTWVDSVRTMRDDLGLDYFEFLSAIDWMPSPFGKGEEDPTDEPVEKDTTIRQGYAGGDTRFQVLMRLESLRGKPAVNVKVDLDDSMTIGSISSVFAGANWHEREAGEMFGITFAGHPDQRNMYLPSDFEGHPLRKDFPLLARVIKPWPGIVDVEPLPGGDEEGGDE
jgi:NADH-quinone oxidoreductase subunit C